MIAFEKAEMCNLNAVKEGSSFYQSCFEQPAFDWKSYVPGIYILCISVC